MADPLGPHAEPHPILAEETALLDDIRERLATLRPPPVATEEDVLAELDRIKQEMRHAKTEDKAALEQQYDLSGRVLEQLRRGRPESGVDTENPYFAHLRVRQEGRVTDVCLGRATRLDEGLRIVDWRHAPVARVFYRYQEGDEYEEDIGNRAVEGRVLVRRLVSVNQGVLDRVSAPQGTFVRGPDGWRRFDLVAPRLATGAGETRSTTDARLGSGRALRADKHLPDSAALIDPAQFELIARPDSGPVVIRGGAGSGKTTVALHRIAWLAYNHPQRFAAHRMMVVVWGRALRDYVSMVLPNLGVRGVAVVTWSEWSRALVQRHFPSLPGHENANTPSVVSRIKLHPELPRLLEAQIAARRAPNTGPSAIEDWKLLLSDARLLGQLSGVTPAEANQVVAWSRAQQAQLALRDERDKAAEPWLDEEDDALLLRAWQLRVGDFRARGGGHLKYTHIAVDEVQDFSPMEIAVLLGTCDAKRCITLAGDTQQHIQKEGGSEEWTSLLGALGVSATALSSLRVSYRSTRSITAFSRALLGRLAEDDAAPLSIREGDPVGLYGFPEHGACVDFVGRALRELLLHEPLAAVAVIAPSLPVARLYFEGFERMELPRLRLVDDQNFAFAPGVDVVDVAQVKGLEFDYVIVVDAGAASWPDRPHHRRLLHVAATRAIHQLWVTWAGDPSEILPRPDRAT